MHGDATFATLTYSEEKVPADGSLDPAEVQRFLKRLRERIRPRRIRFFLAGEYGEITWRPHYHAALFGVPNCLRGRTDHRLERCCAVCELVKGAWGNGGVDCRELSQETAQYLVGYVVKKMTRSSDLRLQGRHPEFARMSLRPGIGAQAMTQLSSSLQATPGLLPTLSSGSLPVPRVLMHGRRQLPLGRYLRGILRSTGVFSDVEEERKARAQELRVLQERIGTAAAVETLKLAPELGACEAMERKQRLFASERSL